MALLAFVSASEDVAGFDAYLQIPKIPGESIGSQHTNWIQLTGFSAGHAAPVGTARPVFANLCIEKFLDSSSPVLAQDCARGTILSSAVIEFIQVASTNLRFYQITLNEVVVKSLSTSGDAMGGVKPVETVCLSFGKITWVYTEFDAAGNPGADTTALWDVVQTVGSPNPTFRIRGSQRTDGLFEVAWTAIAGQTYTILGSPSLTGGFQPVKTIVSTLDGPASQSFLAPADTMFFRVQRQPTPP